MARIVSEVMNRELIAAGASADVDALRDLIIAMGITAVPVLDRERRPVGVLSLRDVLTSSPKANPPVSGPAATVSEHASLEEAGKALAQTDYHHLVVVDAAGRAVGMLSALDVLRGLLGVPARHPAAFPHFDKQLGVSWSDDVLLAGDRIGSAPEGAGVIVLVRGGRGATEAPVWAEGCERIRTRLEELLSIPQGDTPALAALLSHGKLRYRTASVPDAARRTRITETLRERIGHLPLPASAR